MSETELQDAVVTAAELLEVVLEAKLEADQGIAAGQLSVVGFVVEFLQEVFRHGGDDGARQEVGGEHGEADCFGERHEEIARDAAKEEHGHENDADGDGRDQRGYGDLRRAVEDGLLDGLALLEVAIDVLDFDGGVVDENADGEGQAAEGHDVDGFAEGAEHEQRRENRERNGNRDDECAAPAAEEDQNHNCSQAGGDDAFTDDTADRCTDENRLVAERRDLERGRKLALEHVNLGTQALDDVQRGGVTGLDDGEQRGALAVDTDDIGLRRKTVAHVADVADVDHRSVDRANGKIIQLGHFVGCAVGFNLVLEGPDFGSAGRKNDVLGADGGDNVGGSEALGLKRGEVDVHHHFALFAAIGVGNAGSGDRHQLSANEVESEVIELLFCEALPGETELDDGDARRGVLDDQRRRCSLRQLSELSLGNRGDLGDGVADVDLGLEENLDDSDAVHRV